MKKFQHYLRSSIVLALFIASGAIGTAFALEGTIETRAQSSSSSISGITFPVVELGNCASKEACRLYCDDTTHMDACVAFAQAHGLMNKSEGEQAHKFRKQLETGGPGGCTSPSACKAYCDDISHLDVCVQFAEKNNFKGKEYEQGKKMSTYLKTGGQMPGGCTSKESCQTYCGDFAHAEECHAFAMKAGITQETVENADPTGEQLKQLSVLVQKGQTPGGCSTKDTCMAYCQGGAHAEECTTFAVNAGFIKKEDAERIKQFRGNGPGNCNSPDSCHAYCNDQAHRDECFQFAEKNGFIPPEQLKHMKEGLVQMRTGFANVPQPVQDCINTTVGSSTIADVQSGKLIPGEGVGDKMRSCFEKFGTKPEIQKSLGKLPEGVKSCVKEKIGLDIEKQNTDTKTFTPEMADSVRICFQKQEFEKEFTANEARGQGEQQEGRMKIQGMLQSVPPEVASCLKEKLGTDFDKLQSGEANVTQEFGDKMRGCFETFRPQNFQNPHGTQETSTAHNEGRKMMPPQMQGNMQGQIQGQMGGQSIIEHMPPQVASCLKEKLGEDGILKLGQGKPTADMEEIMRTCFTTVSGTGMMQGETNMSVGTMIPPQARQYVQGEEGVGHMIPQGEYQQKFPEGQNEVNMMGQMPPPPLPEAPKQQSRSFAKMLIGAVGSLFNW